MKRILSALTVVSALLASPLPLWAAEAKGAASQAEVQQKFEAFAADWMSKLRERQRFNVENVAWQPAAEGVEAVFVGYDTTNYQMLPLTNLDSTPIGKLVYMELKLRVAGPSKTEALAREPQIIERVEVTELFRFSRGKWVY